jgi:hypothetical protein
MAHDPPVIHFDPLVIHFDPPRDPLAQGSIPYRQGFSEICDPNDPLFPRIARLRSAQGTCIILVYKLPGGGQTAFPHGFYSCLIILGKDEVMGSIPIAGLSSNPYWLGVLLCLGPMSSDRRLGVIVGIVAEKIFRLCRAE